MNQNQLAAAAASAFLILSTVHAQDFRDVEGDAKQGRKTFPILAPEVSRLSMPLVLLSSTASLFFLSESSIYAKAALAAFALITSVRFMVLRTQKQDSDSYLYYYNVSKLTPLFALVLIDNVLNRPGFASPMSVSHR